MKSVKFQLAAKAHAEKEYIHRIRHENFGHNVKVMACLGLTVPVNIAE